MDGESETGGKERSQGSGGERKESRGGKGSVNSVNYAVDSSFQAISVFRHLYKKQFLHQNQMHKQENRFFSNCKE